MKFERPKFEKLFNNIRVYITNIFLKIWYIILFLISGPFKIILPKSVLYKKSSFKKTKKWNGLLTRLLSKYLVSGSKKNPTKVHKFTLHRVKSLNQFRVSVLKLFNTLGVVKRIFVYYNYFTSYIIVGTVSLQNRSVKHLKTLKSSGGTSPKPNSLQTLNDKKRSNTKILFLSKPTQVELSLTNFKDLFTVKDYYYLLCKFYTPRILFQNQRVITTNSLKFNKNTTRPSNEPTVPFYLNLFKPFYNNLPEGSYNALPLKSFEYKIKTIQNVFKILFNLVFEKHFWNMLKVYLVIMWIDSWLTDDEPLWEPTEWSLFQTWLLFIFTFAWIAENLISSRYGSYVGTDKRVWLGWYKTFWLIEAYYALNYGIASLFVIVPFYNEVTYSLYFIVSWWNWFSRIFFFKFITVLTIPVLLSIYLQINHKNSSLSKNLIIILLVNLIILYILYTQFIILMFGYFTNPMWYQESKAINYIQMSHDPAKWSWGKSKRDNFTTHQSRNVFWFKNDPLFVGSFLMFHMFFVVSLFLLLFYWFSLFKRVLATKEVPLTFLTYCVASIKQFLYLFLMFYLMIFTSFILAYLRFPIEQSASLNPYNWFLNLLSIYTDYLDFILSILNF